MSFHAEKSNFDADEELPSGSFRVQNTLSQLGFDDKGNRFYVNHGYSSSLSLAPSNTLMNIDPDRDVSEEKMSRNESFERLKENFSNTCNSNLLKRRLPFLIWLPTITLITAVQDFLAGFTVALTAIPQGIAYGAVAGVPVEYGLYTAFAGPIVYAFLGSVAQVTVGPTAVMALMTSEFVQIGGAPYAIVLSFLTGCVELLAGFLNLGFLVELISGPVISGFCSAAATTVIFSQIKIILGLKFRGSSFPKVVAGIFNHWKSINVWDATLGFSFIVFLMFMKNLTRLKSWLENVGCFKIKWVDRILWYLATCRNALALVIACTLAYSMQLYGLQPFTLTGEIKTGVPSFQVPPFAFEAVVVAEEVGGNSSFVAYEDDAMPTQTFSFFRIVKDLGTGLIMVPVIAVLEQVAIGKGQSKGKKLDSTQEMLALGTGSVVCSFFGCFPLTASFALSSVMSASGAKTQFASLINGCIVLLALVFLMPTFSFIPKAVLGAVIVTAVYTKIECHEVLPMWRARKIELLPFLVTFICCLLVGMEYGILIGTQIHLLLTVFEATKTKCNTILSKGDDGKRVVLLIDRSLHFPSVERIRSALVKISEQWPDKKVLLDFSKVGSIDFTSLKVLQTTLAAFTETGMEYAIINANEKTRIVLLSVLNETVIEAMHTSPSFAPVMLDMESDASEGSEEETIGQTVADGHQGKSD